MESSFTWSVFGFLVQGLNWMSHPLHYWGNVDGGLFLTGVAVPMWVANDVMVRSFVRSSVVCVCVRLTS